jgi:hypothetical protein
MARTVAIERLVTAIEAVDDDDLLIELHEILGIPIEGYLHEITEEESAQIEASQLEIANGKWKTHDQVIENAKKWVLESFGPKEQNSSSMPA